MLARQMRKIQMQYQKPFPAYGISKAEYAKQVQELKERYNQPSEGFFTRLRNKFR